MAHLPILQMSDEEEQSAFTASFSTTSMDSSQEDVKPDLTLLGQIVSAPPGSSHTMEDDDSCDFEDDPFSPQPGSSLPDPDKKKSKKGSKRGGIKGLKQGAAGDDSFTISTLSAGRGQKKLQAAHLTSSLLEEVLNEKKMALLKSPDVIEQLQLLQEDVRVNRQQQQHTQEEKGRPGSSRADSKSRDREARSSRQSQPTAESSSGRQSNQSVATVSSSSCTSSVASGATSSSTSSIWSKEESAFTSVAATTTLSGSNQDT